MRAVTTIVLPVFALVLAGYGARARGLLDGPSVAGLNAFVYWFSLPALLLLRVSETPIRALFDWRLLAAYHAGGLAVFVLAMVLGRLVFGHRTPTLGLHGLAAAYPNVGYMGLPLVLTTFGETATLPAVVVLASDVIVTAGVAVAIVEAGLGSRQRLAATSRVIVEGVVKNPIIMAAAAGAVLSLADLGLPDPLRALTSLLGAAALPCALFALGGALVGRPLMVAGGEVPTLVLLKLVAHPVAVWVMVTAVLPLDPLWGRIAVIEAALPTAATVFVLAQRYEVAVETTSSTVLLSTLVSVATLSLLLGLAAP